MSLEKENESLSDSLDEELNRKNLWIFSLNEINKIFLDLSLEDMKIKKPLPSKLVELEDEKSGKELLSTELAHLMANFHAQLNIIEEMLQE